MFSIVYRDQLSLMYHSVNFVQYLKSLKKGKIYLLVFYKMSKNDRKQGIKIGSLATNFEKNWTFLLLKTKLDTLFSK